MLPPASLGLQIKVEFEFDPDPSHPEYHKEYDQQQEDHKLTLLSTPVDLQTPLETVGSCILVGVAVPPSLNASRNSVKPVSGRD